MLLSAFSLLAQPAIFRGKVTGNLGPLAGATIAIGNQTVLTSLGGEFSISILPGSYTTTITHVGYLKLEQRVTVQAGRNNSLEFFLKSKEWLEEAVVLGSRSTSHRSRMNIPVAVDVITGNNLSQGQIELTQQLDVLIPSYNSPPQTTGSSAHTIPATLRGCNADQTLVLLNGRRRHNVAIVHQFVGMGYGTSPVDLNTIPSAAIDKIEILRDGAAAQYGSDAIAGIINIELKKNTGTTVDLHLGQHYKKDGNSLSFSINRGLQLNRKGFLNLTTDFRFRSPTQRQGIYTGTVYKNYPQNATLSDSNRIKAADDSMILARGFSRTDHRSVGTKQLLSSSFIINGDFSLKKIKLFGTATLNYRLADDDGGPAYRYPKNNSQVNTELFPDGFQPRVFYSVLNFSVIAGGEGFNRRKWHWDVSTVYGGSNYYYNISNTNNASQFVMGKKAPTAFYIGMLEFDQSTTNINFTRNWGVNKNALKSVTVSSGAEFRIDQFLIRAGEEASWKNYSPESVPRKIGGAQALPGYQPANALNKSRIVTAGYIELEMEKNQHFLCTLAGRYEYYSDFGGNLAGKLAVRYKFGDPLSVRFSIGNGFRAPAMQQRYFNSVSQVVRSGQLFVTGNYRNDSDVAAAFGIPKLKAEQSVNIGAGIMSALSKNISISADAYWIQTSKRIILTGLIQRNNSTPKVGEILNNLNRADIDAVRFFTNAINTGTRGIDIIINTRWPLNKSILEISLSANFNKTIISGVVQSAGKLPDSSNYKNILFTREDRARIERSQPPDKVILSAGYQKGKWKFITSHIHYGKVAQFFTDPARNPDEFFSAKIVSSFEFSKTFKKRLTVSIGARNIFDVYPDKFTHYENTQEGLFKYSANGTQIGFNGGYYFLGFRCCF
jgi:iron complex outermembrane receptor protein